MYRDLWYQLTEFALKNMTKRKWCNLALLFSKFWVDGAHFIWINWDQVIVFSLTFDVFVMASENGSCPLLQLTTSDKRDSCQQDALFSSPTQTDTWLSTARVWIFSPRIKNSLYLLSAVFISACLRACGCVCQIAMLSNLQLLAPKLRFIAFFLLRSTAAPREVSPELWRRAAPPARLAEVKPLTHSAASE